MGSEAEETMDVCTWQVFNFRMESFGFARLMLCDSDEQFADQNYSMHQKLSNFRS